MKHLLPPQHISESLCIRSGCIFYSIHAAALRAYHTKKGKSILCLFLISIMLTHCDVIKKRYGVRKKHS